MASAGVLVYRIVKGELEVLLARPGGPYYANKDEGIWGIPKGIIDMDEDAFTAALRELEEETGIVAEPSEVKLYLGTIITRSGKVIHAWAYKYDYNTNQPVKSNLCTITWPPGATTQVEIPEIDRLEYFTLRAAKVKIYPLQFAFLERLTEFLQIPIASDTAIV